MIGVEWARASQFNWTFDNIGGTPLQEVVSGLWSGVTFTVQGNTITIPQGSGGGQVYYLRGVWKTDALFAWGGFWVEPESGGTNYYVGGSFANVGNETIITLGTPLADGTVVQAYYVYNTGAKAAKYDSINSTPCMRQAWRSASDYTYDFAVDRIFDAMAAVYFAYKEQGLDPSDILEFFWNSYIENAASNSSPLVLDDFNRGFYDKGSYLLYFSSTDGQTGFDHFGTQLPSDDFSLGRALRFKPVYYQGSAFSAWFGYGFNWDLTQQYFNTISKVKFKIRGAGGITRVQKFIKTAGAGSANMIVVDGFDLLVTKYYLLTVQTAGAPGTATLLLQRYNADLELENDADEEDDIDGEIILSATSTGPVQLGHGVQAYWEDGALAVGDVWYITCGNQEIKPHRLQVGLNDSIPADPDPWGEEHTFVHGVCDYYSSYRTFEIDFSQFWRLGNIIDCRDRKPGRWGNWSNHYHEIGAPYESLFYDVEDEEVINGETFYTKQVFTWNLDPATTLALGYYVGIPTGVDSTAATTINYLIKQYSGGALTIRTKVRDANSNYFYHDDNIATNVWVRNTVNISAFLPENIGDVLTHPLALVDIGLPDLTGHPGSTLPQGKFEVVDLKFDNHITFTGSDNLRIVEFKYQETSLRLTSGPDWYYDDFGFDLSVEDNYPYVPRLAISLNAYGRNPWRGPTLVHYSHPLAPYLMNRFDIKNTELRLHTDAQNGHHELYGGVKGPNLPVHTRNDIENIALCGEENFNKFCWWSLYRNHGKLSASWHFNDSLIDSSGNGHTLAWQGGGSPTYTIGICQPGNTVVSFDGSHNAESASSDLLDPSGGIFTQEVMFKAQNPDNSYRCIIGGAGPDVATERYPCIYQYLENHLHYGFGSGDTWNATSAYDVIANNEWFHVVMTYDGTDLRLYVNGEIVDTLYVGKNPFSKKVVSVGAQAWSNFIGEVDFAAMHVGRAMSGDEITDRWKIIQGQMNGSDYPETGHALAQLWSFYRLAEYFFVSHDAGAWGVLDNWLTWFDTYLVADGAGWKFPVWFSEYGYAYGDYDAGAAASIVVGCLYVYMRNGDSRALDLAQRLLADLRLYRTSGDYGGYLYKSDYHYAWMNALVAHAFGMAVVGRAGAAYVYPFYSEDRIHFERIIQNFWDHSGDSKPNLLNSDLIPFHDCEPHDIWDYAPDYLFMKEMGSMEGVVLMMHTALDWALYSGSYYWFNTLLEFMIRLGQAALGEQQIYKVNSNFMTQNVATKVNLSYGDYRRDNTLFVEEKDQGMIDLLGEIRQMIPMHYGSPVITEDANTAAKIAGRALEYFATPKEHLQVVADLAAARLDLNDVVKVESKFHGFENDDFLLTRRLYDKKKLRVTLDLMRNVNYSPSWAVDVAGGDYDSYGIDTNSDQDADWGSRAYAN